MNENEKLAKVKKSCNIAHQVSKVLMTILIVASLITLGVGIYMLCNQDRVNSAIANQLQENPGATITVDETRFGDGLICFTLDVNDELEQGMYAIALGKVCIFAFVMCLVFAIIFANIVSIFKTIKISETPFCEAVLKKLKATFIKLFVICVLVFGVTEAIMLGMFLWCVYCILDYGFALQQEVDETL
ncbi:MAG: hypothetical protein PUD20_12285 [bacterium]|nr:hypothetical protein [bacterium]